mmetsp:Transcript_13106/g.23511  ORF Transcript_13106/g.23511 Transcript_13106/m.23511 type:complete len:87 (+) Transcript_13106:393-653(+)
MVQRGGDRKGQWRGGDRGGRQGGSAGITGLDFGRVLQGAGEAGPRVALGLAPQSSRGGQRFLLRGAQGFLFHGYDLLVGGSNNLVP